MWCSIPFPGHFTVGFAVPVTFPTLWNLLNTLTQDVETPFLPLHDDFSQQTSHNIPRHYLLTHMLIGSITELYHIFELLLSGELYWWVSCLHPFTFSVSSLYFTLVALVEITNTAVLTFHIICNLVLLALGWIFLSDHSVREAEGTRS